MGFKVLEKLLLVKELGLANLAAQLKMRAHKACA